MKAARLALERGNVIFGHAPIILPAVLHRPLAVVPRFYVHLVLLGVLALLLFLGNTGLSLRRRIPTPWRPAPGTREPRN